MIRNLIAASLGVLLASSAGAAMAADAQGNFAVRGIGSESCKSLNDQVAKKDPNTGMALESWVAGYISSLNRVQGDTFDASPILANAAVAQMVANVCQRAPTAAVETVTHDIVHALSPARVQKASTNVEAKNATYTVVLRKETLTAIQAELQRQGLSKEAPTGLFTPATVAALKSFQAAHKLTQTGVPDPATLIALLAPSR
jgi:murein L,D-transpeptidase YcbB/YkuD